VIHNQNLNISLLRFQLETKLRLHRIEHADIARL